MRIGRTDVVVEMENDEIVRDCEIIFKEHDPDVVVHMNFEYPVWGGVDGSPPLSPSPPSPPEIDEEWLQMLQVLELPSRLSEKHQLPVSDSVVLVREGRLCAKVFVVDPHNCQLYFVLTKQRTSRRPFGCCGGYAALGDKLYFLGSGDYPDKDYDQVIDFDLDLANTEHVVVESYNLNTKEWDKENTTQLQCPKASPLVFVYDRKIYALEGPISYPLLDKHASFECLDPNTCSASTWTRLQSLPVCARTCCRGILHAQKATFFLKYGEESTWLFAFDLTSGQWNTIYSGDFQLYPVAQPLLQIPRESIQGACIVENILFTFQMSDWGKPLIVYYDLDDIHAKRENIDLSPMLDPGYRFVIAMSSVGYLNYLGDDLFCLVINAHARRSLAVCCCTIELKKVPVRKRYPRVCKEPRLQKFKFRPRLIRCRAYQMPNDVMPRFCQKVQ